MSNRKAGLIEALADAISGGGKAKRCPKGKRKVCKNKRGGCGVSDGVFRGKGLSGDFEQEDYGGGKRRKPRKAGKARKDAAAKPKNPWLAFVAKHRKRITKQLKDMGRYTPQMVLKVAGQEYRAR